MSLMPPPQWPARFSLLLAALAHVAFAVNFAAGNEWHIEPGRPLNISWAGNTQDVSISLYVAVEVPGPAKLNPKPPIRLTEQDQQNRWVVWDAPADLPDALYQFTIWNDDGADYWVLVLGDPASFITVNSSGGLGGGATAGISIGVILIIFGLVATALYLLRRRGIILNRDAQNTPVTSEPDAFLQGGRSTPKPPGGYHHAAEVSGDYTYHEMGGTGDGRMEVSPYPSAAQAAQAYSQPHNTPVYSQTHGKADTDPQKYNQNTTGHSTQSHDDQYSRGRGNPHRYSQAVSQMFESTDVDRSPDLGYSQTMPQPDVQKYPPQITTRTTSPGHGQPSVMPFGHSYRARADSHPDAQIYGHDRHASDTQGLVSGQSHTDMTPSRRQNYQSPDSEAWSSPPRQAMWS